MRTRSAEVSRRILRCGHLLRKIQLLSTLTPNVSETFVPLLQTTKRIKNGTSIFVKYITYLLTPVKYWYCKTVTTFHNSTTSPGRRSERNSLYFWHFLFKWVFAWTSHLRTTNMLRNLYDRGLHHTGVKRRPRSRYAVFSALHDWKCLNDVNRYRAKKWRHIQNHCRIWARTNYIVVGLNIWSFLRENLVTDISVHISLLLGEDPGLASLTSLRRNR